MGDIEEYKEPERQKNGKIIRFVGSGAWGK